MKELANKIKSIIGLKAYNQFIVQNPGIENLRWVINSGVTKIINNEGKRVVFVETDSQRWWIFFNDLFVPVLNYYFSKDQVITQKLIMAFCEKWRTYQGTSLAFWAQALDESFLGDTNDLLPLFPEPERSLLRKIVEFRLERIKNIKT
jgi:hypothetical protein